MHKIRFPRASPRPDWGAYSAPPDLLAVFKGPTSKGREENGKGDEDHEGKGKVKGRAEEIKGEIWPTQTFWRGAPYGLGRRKAIIRPCLQSFRQKI